MAPKIPKDEKASGRKAHRKSLASKNVPNNTRNASDKHNSPISKNPYSASVPNVISPAKSPKKGKGVVTDTVPVLTPAQIRLQKFKKSALPVQTTINENSPNKCFLYKVEPTTIEDSDMKNMNLPISGFTIAANSKHGNNMISKLIFAKAIYETKNVFFGKHPNMLKYSVQLYDFTTGGRLDEDHIYNGKHWPRASLVFTTINHEEDLLNANLQTFINHTLRDDIVTFYNTTDISVLRGSDRHDEMVPFLKEMNDDKAVFTVQRWCDAIYDHRDIPKIINWALNQSLPEFHFNFRSWCMNDKRHIYSCFAPGAIPFDIIKIQKLNEDCMNKEDWLLYIKEDDKDYDARAYEGQM